MRKLFILLVSGVLAFVLMPNLVAQANDDDPKCYDTVVVKAAWTEVIEHPAVTHVVHHDAVTETTPAVWANWAPNDTRGPQNYVPVWPTDERGTWILHSQGIPPGHEGPDGVYQKGEGNSPWFYRSAEKVSVVTPAYDETVVDKAAWTETIQHSAVTEQVEVPCDTDEPPVPPVDEEPPVVGPETPEPPVVGPKEHRKPRAPKPAAEPVAIPTAVDAGM